MAQVGVTTLSELKTVHFYEHDGKSLLTLYNGSPYALRRSVDDRLDDPGDFGDRSVGDQVKQHLSLSADLRGPPTSMSLDVHFPWRAKGAWDSLEHQRQFADWLGERLGIARGEDADLAKWYRVPSTAFALHGGAGLLQTRYHNSRYEFLRAVYPHFEWLPWRFERLPRRVMTDRDTLVAVVRHVSTKLLLRRREDWERVAFSHLDELGVAAFFDRRLSAVHSLDSAFGSAAAWEALLPG